jgi:hypothetical protein
MRIFLSIFLLLTNIILIGQVKQPDRYEIELDAFEDGFEVLPGGENGVVLYRPTNQYQSGHELWQFIKLDTTLSEEWGREYYVNRNNIFKGYDYQDNNYFFLFQLIDQASDLLVIQMNEFSGDTIMHTVKNMVRINITVFEMADDAVLIGGTYNQEPVVLHYDLLTRKTRVLPGIFGDKTELIQVKTEPGLIKVLVATRTFDKRNTLSIKTYNARGDYLDSYTFDPGGDVGLIYGRIAEIGKVGSIISGTYGARRSDYSRGLFIAQHEAGEEQVLKYFNFADLDNFFTYLKAKRQTRISNKITRKKVKGKKVKFNYRILVHEIIERGDTYVMLGEAYYPKYENYGSLGDSFSPAGGSSISYLPSSFAGYRYTHAVVIGFDKNGQKLWDNSFQIEDIVSYSLDQYVQADVLNDDKVVLYYLYNNEIRTKIINGSEVLEGKSLNSVKMMFADDVANKSGISNIGGLDKWFGHNFLAYGIQKIKNMKDSGVKLNRRVFYINKIYYDDTEEEPKVMME